MPSSSKKQHNFMEAVAHDSKFAKKAGVKQNVGKEFAAADKAQGMSGKAAHHPGKNLGEFLHKKKGK